ncbi:hypothetical protein GCM10023189_48890 [Nibrella saemangeumensis]|uniref:Bacterial surface antigen (D15) domain-containing protein n=1 Tax=Nibrella saemangeumensis TaxID=1084526 RepID=A0ABP8NIU5_9BACT
MLLITLLWSCLQAVQPVIKPGPNFGDTLVVVRSVNLYGNIRTRDRIILREMAVRSGDTLRQGDLAGKLAWDQRKITNTNLFITVDVVAKPVVDTTAGIQLVDIEVNMKERWYLFALPTFDLADRNFNEWWYERGRDLRRTIYGGRLSYRNVTGVGDRLALILEFGFTRRTVLSYSRPYIDRAQRTGLRIDFSYATNRDVPYRSAADKWLYVRSNNLLRERAFAAVILTRRNGFYHFHQLDTRFFQNSIADTVARLNPDYFLNGRTRQRYLQLSYVYTYDRRDAVAYPLQGTWLRLIATQMGVLPNDDIHQTELLGSFTRFWLLGGRFYANSGVRAKYSWPERQPYFNLRGLGTLDNFARGYELYVVDGQQYTLWRNNLKYQLFTVRKQLKWVPVRQFSTLPLAAYINVFADAGYVGSTVARQYESRLANTWLLGTGVSLDVVTFYNLVGRFSFSINRQGQTGFFVNILQEI